MGLFDKLFTGLSKTRNNLDELEELFRGYAPDSEDFYDDLEELLVLSDVGVPTALRRRATDGGGRCQGYAQADLGAPLPQGP